MIDGTHYRNGRRLMWSFGSNMSKRQMAERCPGAKRVGPLIVPDGKLIFRLHADVELAEGGRIPGAVWEITAEHERRLDYLEGADTPRGAYCKRYITLGIDGKPHVALYYKMRKHMRGIMRPTRAYYNIIADGYRDFGFDLALLEQALEDTEKREKRTPLLVGRHADRGYPVLARSQRAQQERKDKASGQPAQ